MRVNSVISYVFQILFSRHSIQYTCIVAQICRTATTRTARLIISLVIPLKQCRSDWEHLIWTIGIYCHNISLEVVQKNFFS